MDVPLIENKPLGPIHSLICDHQGKVYLSDEINNRVLCLTEQGKLVWWRGLNSTDSIQFRYPRGLALGRICIRNSTFAECLAVCDSWNNRVVFLSLEGSQIGEWKTAGSQSLREVSDIHYIHNPERAGGMQENQGSQWLLLDRGNHRLCWLGLGGQLRTQIGQPLSPWIERFLKLPDFESLAAKYLSPELRPFSPFDFLYYPTRLLAGSNQILAVYEPLNRSLKIIYGGFLFQLPLDRTHYAWLAFNDSGFLGWNDAERFLAFIDLNGTESLRFATDGVPICADLDNGEWWEQQGQTLTRHALVLVFPTDKKDFGILKQLAALEISAMDFNEIETGLADYLGCLDNLLALANNVASIMDLETIHDLPQPQVLDEMLNKLQLEIEPVKHGLQMLSVPALKWRIGLLDYPEATLSGIFPHLQSFIRHAQSSLNTSFIALVASLDRLVLAGLDFASKIRGQEDRLNTLNKLRSRIDAALWPIGKFLGDCSHFFNLFEAIIEKLPLGYGSSEADAGGSQSGIRKSHSHSGTRNIYTLKEVDHWQIDGSSGLHRSPRHLALSKTGTINISFASSSSILQMTPCGKVLGNLSPPPIPEIDVVGPNGIAWDENGRLWLTYGPSKCAVIWDVSKNSAQVVRGLEENVNGFSVPFAVCKGEPGQMLMSDSADHKIFSISYQGKCKFLTGGRGRKPGQFINPYCLVAAPAHQPELTFAVWIVDHRNHRLQELSMSGDVLSLLGGCGLEKGHFSHPLTAAAFPDGTLAVSMWHLIRCLMLVSPQGEELGRIPIDFIPDEMLALEDRLIVADHEGNQIRVYERR